MESTLRAPRIRIRIREVRGSREARNPSPRATSVRRTAGPSDYKKALRGGRRPGSLGHGFRLLKVRLDSFDAVDRRAQQMEVLAGFLHNPVRPPARVIERYGLVDACVVLH